MSCRRAQTLQERGSSTLFSSLNCVSSQKEYCLSLRVLKYEDYHLCANTPFQVNGRHILSLVSRCQGLQEGVLAHHFPVRIELAFERNAWEMKDF
jgi:hypothetical protein